jgi:predicted glycoside hydrolase/deacetylase ChbG (UPF0249 family)
MTARALIVNADDFGHCDAVNAGIARAFEHGIVTSASLMVDRDGAREAARYATGHPRLSIGLHLDLGEWVFEHGEWRCLYRRLEVETPEVLVVEVERQEARFRRLTGRNPTHLDSHQHVHLDEPVRHALAAVGARLGVPVRGIDPDVRSCGDFYGQTAEGDPVHDRISSDSLIGIIEGLQPGLTELLCHPGRPGVASVYGAERAIELDALCDPRVARSVDRLGVRLCSFGDPR